MTIKFNTKRNNTQLKAIMGDNVRDWYMDEYPTDDMGADLPKEITFYDYFNTLRMQKDVYPLMGQAMDSIIRERIFDKMTTIMGVDYNYIYDRWSNRPRPEMWVNGYLVPNPKYKKFIEKTEAKYNN